MRKYLRAIAKARLTAMGVGNVNKKLATRKGGELPNWKKSLYGETGMAAERAQMNLGKLIKAQKQGNQIRGRRRIKKVSA